MDHGLMQQQQMETMRHIIRRNEMLAPFKSTAKRVTTAVIDRISNCYSQHGLVAVTSKKGHLEIQWNEKVYRVLFDVTFAKTPLTNPTTSASLEVVLVETNEKGDETLTQIFSDPYDSFGNICACTPEEYVETFMSHLIIGIIDMGHVYTF